MKVLVVGLRKEHHRMLQSKFKAMTIAALDDGANHSCKAKKGFDIIVNLTKFTNHSTHNNYRKHPGYKMISGGYSSVVDYLGNYS